MMTIFDSGSGPPLVFIPGIQGRWEWSRPALRALSAHCRTVSYSLCGDFGSGMRYDRTRGFDNYVRQLDAVFERARLERAALCGISYGGFVALRYAAARPGRVSAIVFASSPAPGWVPNAQQQRYLARPWLSAPSFVLTSPGRLVPEIVAAFDTWPARIRFLVEHAARALWYPMIPSVMAERLRLQQATDLAPDCCALTIPALVVSGEPHLDRVVPVAATKRYLELVPDARYVMLTRTGHLGYLTRPRPFAAVVGEFVNDATSR
jgi:pimeloyl-ACP methyl ester carboxylesterase